MGYKGTRWSKSQYHRRRKRAKQLGCAIENVPDSRGRHGNHARGRRNHRWNQTNKIISQHGYVKIRVGRHPLADPNGYAYEHLIVWASSGRSLPANGELIHHKNEDKTDNRLENLEVMKRSKHGEHHIAQRNRNAAGRLLDGREWNEIPVRERVT